MGWGMECWGMGCWILEECYFLFFLCANVGYFWGYFVLFYFVLFYFILLFYYIFKSKHPEVL